MKRVILIVALVVSAGCAAKQYHTATVVDVALYEVINTIHADEQLALCGLPSCKDSAKVEFLPGWTLAKSQAFNKPLATAAAGGMGFNEALVAWKPGTPLPYAVANTISDLGAAVATFTSTFPDGAVKTKILANISKAQMLMLQGLAMVLIAGGK
jgi:hypothetical protein